MQPIAACPDLWAGTAVTYTSTTCSNWSSSLSSLLLTTTTSPQSGYLHYRSRLPAVTLGHVILWHQLTPPHQLLWRLRQRLIPLHYLTLSWRRIYCKWLRPEGSPEPHPLSTIPLLPSSTLSSYDHARAAIWAVALVWRSLCRSRTYNYNLQPPRLRPQFSAVPFSWALGN